MAGLNWINHMYHDLRFIELLVRRKWDKLDKCNTNYRHRLPHVFINRNKLQGCYRDPQTGSQAFELFQLQIETSYEASVTIPGRLSHYGNPAQVSYGNPAQVRELSGSELF